MFLTHLLRAIDKALYQNGMASFRHWRVYHLKHLIGWIPQAAVRLNRLHPYPPTLAGIPPKEIHV